MDKKLHKEEVSDKPVVKEPYPKAIYFILGNEFCERFSYYGIRTISSLYLTQYLLYTEDTATVIFHFFVTLAYFTPLLGAILADSWLGKYKTILYVSLVYALGNVVVSVGAIPSSLNTMRIVSILGFIVIGFGTGGIKPCVSAFGGDQFSHNQDDQRKRFFSIFYFAINAGSFISTIITPELRADVECFGEDTCYPLAFGVPAVLMVLSIILFIAGKALYVQVPVTGNVTVRLCKCVWHALKRKMKSKEKKKEHFMDYAEDQYEKAFIDDVKILLHVLWIFLPLPVFWTLFDQTSSRWTLQASKLDGEVWGYVIKADQMQSANPIMILVFIPLFDYVIYPLLNKCNLLTKPLQRITVGGFIAALSFLMAGFLELSIENALPVPPRTGMSEWNIINNSPCLIHIDNESFKKVDPFQYEFLQNVPLDDSITLTFTPSNCSTKAPVTKTFNATNQWELITVTVANGQLQVDEVKDIKSKSKNGEPQIRLIYSTDVMISPNKNTTFKLEGKKDFFIKPSAMNDTTFGDTGYEKPRPGKYRLYLPSRRNGSSFENTPIGSTDLKSGGSYIAIIYRDATDKVSKFHVFETVTHNSVSILWQIPQYIVITAAEIMFSITGLEFSYSQAPLSLKSVMQSCWLLTVAIGNFLVMFIVELSIFNKKSYELFMFCVLMALDMVVFMVMAYFYKYRHIRTQSEEQLEMQQKANSNSEETDFNK